ncbi:MAG TPA: hypothetical protein ENJ82_12890 [Bacteroidetes bacterium]|nr:hypothetical protein [Bacteroidota bacterium]
MNNSLSRWRKVKITLIMVSILGCNPSGTEKGIRNEGKENQPYNLLITDPVFWQIGDSVVVGFEPVYDAEKWMPGGIEILLPHPEPNWIDSDTFKLLWIPDESLLEMMPPVAKVIDDFLVPSHEFGISREVEFHAIRNSEGKYHFERQAPTSVIDTFHYK